MPVFQNFEWLSLAGDLLMVLRKQKCTVFLSPWSMINGMTGLSFFSDYISFWNRFICIFMRISYHTAKENCLITDFAFLQFRHLAQIFTKNDCSVPRVLFSWISFLFSFYYIELRLPIFFTLFIFPSFVLTFPSFFIDGRVIYYHDVWVNDIMKIVRYHHMGSDFQS